MNAPLNLAPGSIVVVRDEEWLVTQVRITDDGQLLTVQGLGDLVRGMTDLGITPESVGTLPSAARPIVNAPPPVFTSTLLGRMP